MDNREYFIKRFDGEQRAFTEVLRAVPTEKFDYAPHERSTKAGDLAWQIAEEQRVLIGLIEAGEIHMDIAPRPATSEEIVAAYEASSKTLRERLAAAADTWERPATFYMGEHMLGNQATNDFAWGFLFDMVHHRGQLAAYLRPMGAKVPAIYGPSGDSR
jgi:uncharacterized damage-inducible protein DinB